MATSTARRSTKSSKSSASDQGDDGQKGSGIGSIINSGLSSSFDSIREKIAQTISNNGEEYLHEAMTKITKTTSKVVEWSKKNPVKLAIGVAALMAVSAFLVHTMKNSSTSSSTGKRGKGKTLAARA